MSLEGQVRERNLNPKNAAMKRRPEIAETLQTLQAFAASEAFAAEANEAAQQEPQVIPYVLLVT